MKEKITKKMVLGKIITKYPQTMEIFFKYGLPCAMCHLASDETVEQAAEAHEVELSKLLKDLNKAIMKK